MSLHSFDAPPRSSTPAIPRSELAKCKALIIDTNQTSRSILRSMMGDLGINDIMQAGKITDARRALETHVFDVVLCDYHFDDSDMNGADLLEDLRRAQLLPYSTVFIMITAESSYVKVAEAAESALDSYLLKPHNLIALEQRLHLARHRKLVLASIFEAIEREEYEAAASLCIKRFASRGEYWVYAARIGGELLLRLERHDEARKLFAAIDETKALPWARLGIARAQLDGGHAQPAKRTLECLIAENPSYADAYDVMGRAQLQAGEFEDAYETYMHASEVTPSSICRLQKVGMLAFYLGRQEEATRSLERATSLGITSKMFDLQSLVMLAQLRFEHKDSKGLLRCLGNLQHACTKMPKSRRVRRMTDLVEVLHLMLQRQVAEVVRLVKTLAQEIDQPDFDFEAGGNLLGLLMRLVNSELSLPDAELWVQKIAHRFCISKASTDLMAMAVSGHPPYVELVRGAYKLVIDTAERSMSLAKDGAPAQGVKMLLVQGSKLMNAKLLDLADMFLQRYQASIEDHEVLTGMVADMRGKYCVQAQQVHLGGKASGTGRQAGGIQLRA